MNDLYLVLCLVNPLNVAFYLDKPSSVSMSIFQWQCIIPHFKKPSIVSFNYRVKMDYISFIDFLKYQINRDQKGKYF